MSEKMCVHVWLSVAVCSAGYVLNVQHEMCALILHLHRQIQVFHHTRAKQRATIQKWLQTQEVNLCTIKDITYINIRYISL